ncbi:MAG: glycerophosphodiester phosphodiesterase family protein [Armatimonadetes bacterium]|nr:glycerophosphodiester phosphodiesterase family protein [Armatimonadota bacterium]
MLHGTVFAVTVLILGTGSDQESRPAGGEARVAVIGHRGGAALGPENTLACYEKAIELGADYVEIDVRTTRDGRFVLMHDRTVDRTTDGKGAVADLSFAAIRALDAGSWFAPEYAGQRAPTLGEALALCRGRIGIYLDHKEGSVPAIARVIRKAGMMDQVVVYDGPEEVAEWKRVAPRLPVMISPDEEDRHPGGIAELLAKVPADILDGNAAEWTADLVAEAHAHGARVFVDNLGPTDNAEWYRQAIEMGVDGIQTDHPDEVIRLRSQVSGLGSDG